MPPGVAGGEYKSISDGVGEGGVRGPLMSTRLSRADLGRDRTHHQPLLQMGH